MLEVEFFGIETSGGRQGALVTMTIKSSNTFPSVTILDAHALTLYIPYELRTNNKEIRPYVLRAC